MFAVVTAAGLLTLAGCVMSGRARIVEGEHYTRYSLYSQDGVHHTRNPRPAMAAHFFEGCRFVPINTKVELLQSGGDTIELRTEDGSTLIVQNDPRATGGSLWDAYRQVLAPKPIDLSEFGGAEQRAIETGQVLPGMTKKAVLAAFGPPPQSGTISLSSTVWKYWRDERSPVRVHFDAAGRVLEVQ